MPDGPHFSLALLAGRPIAVIALQPVMIGQGEPSKWNTHIAVHNMMIRGRKTSALDPVPLAVRNSQPRQYITAHLVGEPGTLAWDRLIIADEADAPPFHQHVQDLHTHEMAYVTGSYTIFTMDGVPLAGVATPHGPRTTNYRHSYFTVADTDMAVALIKRLGGSVLIDPTDTSAGRISRVADPQGAAFGVMRPADNVGARPHIASRRSRETRSI